jgi:hypothetical protein
MSCGEQTLSIADATSASATPPVVTGTSTSDVRSAGPSRSSTTSHATSARSPSPTIASSVTTDTPSPSATVTAPTPTAPRPPSSKHRPSAAASSSTSCPRASSASGATACSPTVSASRSSRSVANSWASIRPCALPRPGNLARTRVSASSAPTRSCVPPASWADSSSVLSGARRDYPSTPCSPASRRERRDPFPATSRGERSVRAGSANARTASRAPASRCLSP